MRQEDWMDRFEGLTESEIEDEIRQMQMDSESFLHELRNNHTLIGQSRW